MNDLIIVGDVHGKHADYLTLCNAYRDDTILQIGDMGVGFRNDPPPTMPANQRFFRGNHDNPAICRQTQGYLGEFGTATLEGIDFFYAGGAWSIDGRSRLPGVSWWPDEELNASQAEACFDQYVNAKPSIVFTHQAPDAIAHALLSHYFIGNADIYPTATGRLLTAMLNAWRPRLWVFGHYHIGWQREVGGTKFICIPELGTLNLRTEELSYPAKL